MEEIKIKRARNGFIMTTKEHSDSDSQEYFFNDYVYEDKINKEDKVQSDMYGHKQEELEEMNAFVDMIYSLKDALGLCSNYYWLEAKIEEKED